MLSEGRPASDKGSIMTRLKRRAAMALAAILLCASAAPSQAKMLFSIGGKVGDPRWAPAPDGTSEELVADLSDYFQSLPFAPQHPVLNPAGGLLQIVYSGPSPITASFNEFYSLFYENDYSCARARGCGSRAGLVSDGGDDDLGGAGWTPAPAATGSDDFRVLIDSTMRFSSSCDGFVAASAVCADRWKGNDGFIVDTFVDPSGVGRPFSLTVTTVPEPATWAFSLIGLGLTGAALRRRTPIRSDVVADKEGSGANDGTRTRDLRRDRPAL